MTTRVDRIITIRPDASLPAWSIFVDDETGQAVSYAGQTTFTVMVRTAASLVPVAGSMTAHAAASLTGDNDLPTDVPSLRFTPTAGSLALVPATATRATILVYVGSGDVERLDVPARVVA